MSVGVSGQTLSATVGAGGLWTVNAATLAEASHTVVASVTVGGDTDTATQVLTVDATAPVLTIDGGAARSTTDTTPRLQGTSTEPVGTPRAGHRGRPVPDRRREVRRRVGRRRGHPGRGQLHRGRLDHGRRPEHGHRDADPHHRPRDTAGDAAGDPAGHAPANPPATVYPPSRYKPDAEIRGSGANFVGGGEYGASKQSVTEKLGKKAKSVTFDVRVTNRGDVADRLTLLGAPKTKAFKVTYLAGGKNVTKEVVAGTYRTSSLKPGESVVLTVKIAKAKGAKKGSKGAFTIRATSSVDSLSQDTVTALVKVA